MRAGLLALALVLGLAGGAEAQARALELDGEPGVWLPLVQAQMALQARETAPRLHHRVALLEARLEMAGQEAAILRQAVDRGQATEDALRLAVTAASERAEASERARAALDAWWRHPALWFVLGAVVAGAVALGVALGT